MNLWLSTIKWMAGILLFVLPLYLIKIGIPGGSINLLDIYLSLFLLTGGVYLGKRKKQWLRFKKYWETLPGGWFFLLLLALGAALGLSGGNLDTLGIIKSFYLLPLLAAILVNFLIKEKVITLLGIFKGYLGLNALLALGAFFFWFSGRTTFDGRLQFIFNSPNHLAMLLASSLVVVFFFLLNSGLEPKSKERYALGALGSLILMALFLTHSLGAALSLILSLGLLMILAHNKKSGRFWLALLGFIFGIFLIFAFALPQILERFNYSPFLNRSSLDSRLVIYEVSAKLIKDNWFWGIGPGNFLNQYLNYQQYFPPYPQWAVPHPHNVLLAFWLSFGILGLVIFALFFIRIWGAAGKIEKKEDVLALALVFYFLCHGLFDVTFIINDLALVFWIVAVKLTAIKD